MSSYGNNIPPAGMSVEQAQKLAAQTYQQNEKDLANNLHLEADADGKYTFFGIEVPASIAPAINILSDGFIGSISSGLADIAYKQAKSAAKSFNLSHDDAHQAGIAAEMVMRWGVLFAKPIGEFVSVNTEHGQTLLKLRRELKADCDAVGANYAHNRVINGALREESQHYTDRLKLILPSMLSLVSQVPGAYMSQKEAWTRRDAEHAGTVGSHAVDDLMLKQMTRITEGMNRTIKEQEIYEKTFKEWKTKHSRNIPKLLEAEYGTVRYGNPKSKPSFEDSDTRENYARKYFNDRLWSPLKQQMLAEDTASKASKAGANGETKPEQGGLLNNQMMIATALSTMGQGIKSSMLAEQKKRPKKPTAYAMIYKLKEHMQGHLPQAEVHKEVMEIFQTVEEENGGPSRRFAKGLQDALRDATAPIAEYIAEGKIDPLALIKLAGEEIVIDRKHDTRQFREVDAIRKSLDEMCCSQVIKDKESSQQEFLGRFNVDHDHVNEAIKKTYNEMEAGQAKDLFAAVLPLDVLEKQLGMDKDEVREVRKRAHNHIYPEVAASVILIAEQAEKDEKLLQKHGVSSKEIATIKQLSEQIRQGNMEIVKELVDSKDNIVTVVAAEGVHEMLEAETQEAKEQVWAKRVAKGKDLKNIIEETKARKHGGHEEGEAEARPHREAHKTPHQHAHSDRSEDEGEHAEIPEEHRARLQRHRDEHGHEEHRPKSHREHAKHGHDGAHLGQGV